MDVGRDVRGAGAVGGGGAAGRNGLESPELPRGRVRAAVRGGGHGHRERRRRRRLKKTGGLSLAELSALKVGDFVVHEDHGVGKLLGFETKAVAGVNDTEGWFNIRFFSTQTGETTGGEAFNNSRTNCVAWSPDGRSIFSWYYNGLLVVRDAGGLGEVIAVAAAAVPVSTSDLFISTSISISAIT